MIVQQLHAIQDAHGYLPRERLRQLSSETGTPLYRLQEVASFFPHFRLTPPPAVELLVCRDMACHRQGSGELLAALGSLNREQGEKPVRVAGVSCLGRCDRAPAACLGGHLYLGRNEVGLRSLVAAAVSGELPPPDHDADLPGPKTPWKIDPYAGQEPSYKAVRSFKDDPGAAERVLEELKTADLRGMGGAGFSTVERWSDVRIARGDRKFILCNADESEPATFKDRELLLRTPHLILEGMILAGLVTGATQGYVYVRHEYEEQIETVRAAIRQAELLGACGDDVFGTGKAFHLDVFVSPGGYICGEMSALVEAMEDHRAEPRPRPPKLETNGLFGMPTVVNNVETLAWVPAIVLNGGGWYAGHGRNGRKGLRFFSVCGDVARPGVHEVPCGLTLRELINDCCGGLRGGRPLKAIAPSGPSGGFLPARLPLETLPRTAREKLPKGATHLDVLDLHLDLTAFRDLGLMLGAGLAVYAGDVDLVALVVNCLEFFRNESCGKCVPCRLGSQKMVEIGTDLKGSRYTPQTWLPRKELVAELAQAMSLTSICGLGAAAANPMTSLIRYFPDDLARYLGGERPVA